jgi:hypothetical protein
MSESDVEKNEELENAEQNKWLAAKKISKLFKFISPIGLVTCAFLKWIGILPGATIPEIILVWVFVYGLGAGTIDVNLIIDKFRN